MDLHALHPGQIDLKSLEERYGKPNKKRFLIIDDPTKEHHMVLSDETQRPVENHIIRCEVLQDIGELYNAAPALIFLAQKLEEQVGDLSPLLNEFNEKTRQDHIRETEARLEAMKIRFKPTEGSC